MTRFSFRRFAPGMVAVALAAMLGGCSGFVGGVSDAGAAITGREHLAPLSVKPSSAQVSVQFLPFTGAPVTIADAIYRRIREEAPKQGIMLVHRLEEPATFRVKAHLVALGNETSTNLIVTWDIFDAEGNNVWHRVMQDQASAGQGDAWAGVGGEAQDRIASAGIRSISAWLRGNRH